MFLRFYILIPPRAQHWLFNISDGRGEGDRTTREALARPGEGAVEGASVPPPPSALPNVNA